MEELPIELKAAIVHQMLRDPNFNGSEKAKAQTTIRVTRQLFAFARTSKDCAEATERVPERMALKKLLAHLIHSAVKETLGWTRSSALSPKVFDDYWTVVTGRLPMDNFHWPSKTGEYNFSYKKINLAFDTNLLPRLMRVAEPSTLVLNGNNFNDIMTARIADMLRFHPSLHVLKLSYNRIGNSGADALAGALCDNTSLHILDLDGNRITDAGASKLVEAFGSRRTLLSSNEYMGLYMTFNRLTEDTKKRLKTRIVERCGDSVDLCV